MVSLSSPFVFRPLPSLTLCDTQVSFPHSGSSPPRSGRSREPSELLFCLLPLSFPCSPFLLSFDATHLLSLFARSITRSPVYSAGQSYLGGDRGLSIRFPRFIKIREDKGCEDATTSEQ